MCGSFTCSKNSLIALNIFYVVVAVVLIGVAGAAKYSAIITSLSVVSGIIICGVFLLMIAIVGLVAANRHHQVLLFFYMIVLFIIFVLQFAIACACLAMNESQQEAATTQGWSVASDALKNEAQMDFGCCGYENLTTTEYSMGHPSCFEVVSTSGDKCCPVSTEEDSCCATEEDCQCPRCKGLILNVMGKGFAAVGGVGLFFSFTEIFGCLLAHSFRHQMDPRANIQSLLQRN